MPSNTAGGAPLITSRFHVSLADIDAAMILSFAAPLMWASRVLLDWRRAAGQSMSQMLDEGRGSPVVRSEITYLRPLRLDDEVEATLWFKERSARSYTVVCRFAAGPAGPLAAEVEITQVTVTVAPDGEMRAVEIPAGLVAALDGAPKVGGDDNIGTLEP